MFRWQRETAVRLGSLIQGWPRCTVLQPTFLDYDEDVLDANSEDEQSPISPKKSGNPKERSKPSTEKKNSISAEVANKLKRTVLSSVSTLHDEVFANTHGGGGGGWLP
jgi:hypothetical protein